MVEFRGLRIRLPRREDLAGALDRVPAGAVDPFVAGESVGSAVAAVAEEMSRGRSASLLYLPTSESVGAARIVDLQVISALADEDLSDGTDLTLDLVALGLGQTGADALATDVAAVARAAADVGMTVTLAGLTHARVQAGLALHRELSGEFPNLGVTLGANLLRTEGDCVDLAAAAARVRLVKRESAEPAGVAFGRPHDVDKSYVRCLRALMGGAAVTVATHDERLLEIAAALAEQSEGPAPVYQFRRGLRTERAAELVATGASVSILVPFGPDWPTYVSTRIAPTPAAVGQAVRGVVAAGEAQ